MASPIDLVLITNPLVQLPNHQAVLTTLKKQFKGIVIHQISLPRAYQTFTFPKRNNRIFLILNHSRYERAVQAIIPQFLGKLENMGWGTVLFPVKINDYKNCYYAQTVEELVGCLNEIQRKSMMSSDPTSPISHKSNIPYSPLSLSQIPGSHKPRLMINYYKSQNQIYRQDINKLFLRFQSDSRVKFNEINHLSQIPNIDRNLLGAHNVDNLLFVSDTDAQTYMNQYNQMTQQLKHNQFNMVPLLYNTSNRNIPTNNYFQSAFSSLDRAALEVQTYISKLSFPSQSLVGSQNNIVSSSSIPHIISNNVVSNLNTTTNLSNYTRLIILDPNTNPLFTSFYRSLPIDYKLIPHLRQNSVFQYPTILLAPIESYEHVINRILVVQPDIHNLKCIFYDVNKMSSIGISNLSNHKYIKMVSGSNQEIQSYLRTNNVLFVNGGGMRGSRVIVTDQTSAFIGVGGHNSGRYRYEWNVKKRPGIQQRYVTYDIKDEWNFQQNRLGNYNSTLKMQQTNVHPFPPTISTIRGPTLQQNTTVTGTQNKINSLQNYQIHSIPSQSKLVTPRSFAQPRNSITEQRQITTTTTKVTPAHPIQHISKVIEEEFQQITIGASFRGNKSMVNSNQNNHTITVVDQTVFPTSVPLIEVIPPSTSNIRILETNTVVQPLIIPPAPVYVPPPPLITKQYNEVVSPMVNREVFIENTVIQPVVTQKIEVPSITNGYYSSTTTTPIVIPSLTHSRSQPNFNSTTITTNYVPQTRYVPPQQTHTHTLHTHRSVSPSVNLSRKGIESQRIDPLKYQKIMRDGKVVYVMKQQYKTQLINDAVGGKNVVYDTSFNDYNKRRSRVLYDTKINPSYNDIEYVVETNPRRRSRVIEIVEDVPTTTTITNRIHTGGVQVMNHPSVHSYSPVRSYSPSSNIGFDPLKFEEKIENGVKVYYRRSNVSPLRRSNLIIEQPYHQINNRTIIHQPLRKSIVIEQAPRRSSRVIIQNNNYHIPTTTVTRNSRYLESGDILGYERDMYSGGRVVHLVFKKLNASFLSLSQLFKDSNYRVHKYYSFTQLASILRGIPSHEPVLLILDQMPDFSTNDFINNHLNVHLIVIPKNNNQTSFRNDQINHKKLKHKYKYIFQQSPDRMYYQMMDYLNQFIIRPGHSQRVSVTNVPHYVSPPHYTTKTTNAYSLNDHATIIESDSRRLRPSMASQSFNNSRKIILYPTSRNQIKDYLSYKFPSTFQYIPYYDIKSLTKQLDYWPGNNLIVILGEQLTQQIGVVMRLSRNAEYIVYDPDNRGYEKQDYNAVRRIRDIEELGREMEELLSGKGIGAMRGKSYY